MSESKWKDMSWSQRRDAVAQSKAAYLIVSKICKKAPELELIAHTLERAESLAGRWLELDDERQRLQRRVEELERAEAKPDPAETEEER